MSPRVLLHRLKNAYLYSPDLISFLGQLSWAYSHKLPEWFFDKENIIRFRYPDPIGCITLKVRNNKSDTAVFAEVFNHQYYNLGLKTSPKTILDLGANAGFTTVYFHKCFPKAQIACVEPIPRNIESLRVNLALNQVPAQIFPAAIAIEDGSILMEIMPWDFAHRAIGVSATIDESAKTLSVPALTVPTICNQLQWQHIDLLKVDIEGYERILFSRECSWLKQVNSMCIEWHEDSEKWDESWGREDLIHLAEKYGFNKPRHLPGIWLLQRTQL